MPEVRERLPDRRAEGVMRYRFAMIYNGALPQTPLKGY